MKDNVHEGGTLVMNSRIPILFSDVSYGTIEYGFIPRSGNSDPDDEDAVYERHLVARGVPARVVDGVVIVRK